MNEPDVADFERLKRIGERIAIARGRQNLSLECLAELTGLDEKTIRTAIGGHRVRPRSLIAICNALNISLESEIGLAKVASHKYGSYNLDHYKEFVGNFFAFRRGFTRPDNIIRTIYQFSWRDSDNEPRLCFEEDHKYIKRGRTIDYSQSGDIYIHNERNIIQLLTSDRGDLRLISLARMQDRKSSLSGIVATNAHLAFFNQPSASAIYFHKIEEALLQDQRASMIGPIYRESPEYKIYDAILKDVEQNVSLFAVSSKDSSCEIDELSHEESFVAKNSMPFVS